MTSLSKLSNAVIEQKAAPQASLRGGPSGPTKQSRLSCSTALRRRLDCFVALRAPRNDGARKLSCPIGERSDAVLRTAMAGHPVFQSGRESNDCCGVLDPPLSRGMTPCVLRGEPPVKRAACQTCHLPSSARRAEVRGRSGLAPPNPAG